MGWARGFCFLLAGLALPGTLRADFVHMLPSARSAMQSGDSVLPPTGTPTTATPADPITSPKLISTAPDEPSNSLSTERPEADEFSAPRRVAATLAKNPPLQLPPEGAAKGVRPLLLNDAAHPAVPEPSMLRYAAIALMGFLARRRRDVPVPAGRA